MSKRFGNDINRGPGREGFRSSLENKEPNLAADGFEEDEGVSAAMRDTLEAEADSDGADEEFDDEAGGEETFEANSGVEEFDDGPQEFSETAESRAPDSLEEAVIGTVGVQNTDEFFSRLYAGVRRVVRHLAGGISASTAGKEAGRAERPSNRTSERSEQAAGPLGPVARPLQEILPILQMFASQGLDELQAFQDIADWFAEGEKDEALPVLAGIAARAMTLPLVGGHTARLSRPVIRALVNATTQATHSLIQQGGAQAVRALPHIVRSVARTALRRRLPIKDLPEAVLRTTSQIATQPALMRRLTSLGASTKARSAPVRVVRLEGPQRFQIHGPVEITITKI
jgi:hypothetical protein